MAIEPNEAIDIILQKVKFDNYEIIPLELASGRIIAQDIFATISLPRFNNSAMDGYTIPYNYDNNNLKICGKIFAGDKNNLSLEANQTYKIMTGAPTPSNTFAIVPQEDIKILDEQTIEIPNTIKKNAHIRFIGEDISDNELLIKKGEEINFAKITLLASQGISNIKVYQKPKVSVFASGEELKLHFQNLENHQIYNSNTPTLLARSKELGSEVKFVGCAKDSIESIKEHINNSLDSNLIVTSGGVSVGEADFTQPAFNEFDYEILIDGILIKPGKPTLFGKINNSYILNLPGNPLASALIFEVFGKLIIQKLTGSKDIYFNYILANLSSEIKIKNRTTIVPGYFDGTNFEAYKKTSPGMVNVLAHCNAMIIVSKECKSLNKNQKVKVLPINWKFFTDKQKDFLTNE